MAPQKTTVMSGLKQIKGSAGQTVASKLLPEIIRVFRVFDTLEDEDIQVPIMLKFLTNRRKSSSILIDVSAGTREEGRTIISAGAIPLIVEKLQNRVDWMGPQATEVKLVWCLMNLATDGEEFRKVLVAHRLNDILVRTSLFQANI